MRKDHIRCKLFASQNPGQCFQTSFQQDNLGLELGISRPYGFVFFPLKPQAGKRSDCRVNYEVLTKQISLLQIVDAAAEPALTKLRWLVVQGQVGDSMNSCHE